jgi:hypothetical protein
LLEHNSIYFLYSLIVALFFYRFFSAWFSSDGIYGHLFWGVRRFIRWQDIASVRRFSLLKLPWIRIYSGVDGKVTWLPLFQSRPFEFRQTIKEFAPFNSPILTQLDN